MKNTNTRKCAATFAALLGALFFSTHSVDAAESARPEPNLEIAKEWWPDLTDYWTPVGWKHHRFRYNVFFDGTIYADPGLSQTAEQWKDQGVQLRVLPTLSTDEKIYNRFRSERYELEDDHRSIQGWTTNKAPVLWTEWSRDGLLLRQNMFAYVPGGQHVESGLEPLFAWVRLSVYDTCEGMPVPKRYSICLQFNAPHVRATMAVRKNIIMQHEKSRYPRALKTDSETYDAGSGLRIIEPDGKVRLAIAPGAKIEAGFLPGDDATNRDPLLYFEFDAVPGEKIDLLIPMVPTEHAVLDSVLARGYDAALAEADLFWSERPDTAATIDVPETEINHTLHQFERFAEVLSERVPETGKNVSLSGSLAYVKVWATPTGKNGFHVPGSARIP